MLTTAASALTTAAPVQEGASPWATGFFAVVAFGAVIYFVVTRRAEKKECKHEQNMLRTAERKRAVREDLTLRAQTKLDKANHQVALLEERGGAERNIERAKAEVALCEQQLAKHHEEVDKALEVERKALENLQACMLANDAARDEDSRPA